jgi:hypothetical protein
LGPLKTKDNVLFFLDAHFPDADYNGANYDVNAPNAIPLKEELELIKKYRPGKKDYIICDDARIYENRRWEQGAYPYRMPIGGFDFIRNIFGKKRVKISLKEHGYILIDNR